MSLKVNIDHNFHDLAQMMDELGNKDIGSSARTAINKALTRGVSVVVKQLRKDINLKSTGTKKRIKVIKAKGSQMHRMEGVMIFSGTPIQLLEFVVGNKSPIKQKGIKVRKRRKLKVRFKPGKTIHVKGGFIQDVRSKQVFRRRSQGRKLRKLSTSSLAVVAFRQPRLKILENTLLKRFDRIFDQQIRWRHGKTTAKYSKSPMRIPK